jgi:hypothetical protein
MFERRAMAQAVSRGSVTAEERLRSRAKPCELCGGQSCTGTGFHPNVSVSLVTITLPVLRTYVLINITLTRRTSGRTRGTLNQITAVSDIGE